VQRQRFPDIPFLISSLVGFGFSFRKPRAARIIPGVQ
jgi:hypothetical protein